jgi:hypothetical protein
LQADFCKPAAGSRLEPDESLSAVYNQALTEYQAML